MEAVRVLVVDDHFVVREGTKALLAAARNVELAGEARDGREAVAQAELLQPDVILMDLMMPEMDGVEATRQILARQPEAKVLVLTGTNVDDKILAALRAGALGYVTKECGQVELVRAIEQAHRGQTALPLKMARRLFRQTDPAVAAAAPPELLTPRELEVLRLVAKGWSNRRIAETMHLSPATIRTHVHNILAKLSLSNRVEATLYALEEGLTTLEEWRGTDLQQKA